VLGVTPQERPEDLRGCTRRVTTGCGSLFVTMNSNENGLFEVFVTLGKAGGCAAAQVETMGRLVSLALRSGVGIDNIIKHLIGTSCSAPAGFGPGRVLSCADAVAKALRWFTQQNLPPVVVEEGSDHKM
jgi:ribonucleoside-diphosphate reductase alpha chain